MYRNFDGKDDYFTVSDKLMKTLFEGDSSLQWVIISKSPLIDNRQWTERLKDYLLKIFRRIIWRLS